MMDGDMEIIEEVNPSTPVKDNSPISWGQTICVFCSSSLTHSDKNTPKLLTCLHAACNDCIHKHAFNSHVNCKACTQTVQLTEIIDHQFILGLQQSTNNNENEQNATCSCSDQAPVSSFCNDCQDWLCDECVSAHQRVRFTKDHVIKKKSEVEAADSQATPGNRYFPCPVHKQELLKLYCETCDKLTCRDCQLVEHKDHKYQFLSNISGQYKSFLTSLLTKIKEKSNFIENAQSLIHKRQSEVLDREVEVTKEIKLYAVQLISLINQRGKQLLQSLNEVCNKKKSQLASKDGELNNLLMKLDHCYKFAESAVRESSDSALVYSKKLITNQLRNVLHRRCEIPNPSHIVDIRFVTDNKYLPDYINVVGQIISDQQPHGNNKNNVPNVTLPNQGPPQLYNSKASYQYPQQNHPPNQSQQRHPVPPNTQLNQPAPSLQVPISTQSQNSGRAIPAQGFLPMNKTQSRRLPAYTAAKNQIHSPAHVYSERPRMSSAGVVRHQAQPSASPPAQIAKDQNTFYQQGDSNVKILNVQSLQSSRNNRKNTVPMPSPPPNPKIISVTSVSTDQQNVQHPNSNVSLSMTNTQRLSHYTTQTNNSNLPQAGPPNMPNQVRVLELGKSNAYNATSEGVGDFSRAVSDRRSQTTPENDPSSARNQVLKSHMNAKIESTLTISSCCSMTYRQSTKSSLATEMSQLAPNVVVVNPTPRPIETNQVLSAPIIFTRDSGDKLSKPTYTSAGVTSCSKPTVNRPNSMFTSTNDFIRNTRSDVACLLRGFLVGKKNPSNNNPIMDTITVNNQNKERDHVNVNREPSYGMSWTIPPTLPNSVDVAGPRSKSADSTIQLENGTKSNATPQPSSRSRASSVDSAACAQSVVTNTISTLANSVVQKTSAEDSEPVACPSTVKSQDSSMQLENSLIKALLDMPKKLLDTNENCLVDVSQSSANENANKNAGSVVQSESTINSSSNEPSLVLVSCASSVKNTDSLVQSLRGGASKENENEELNNIESIMQFISGKTSESATSNQENTNCNNLPPSGNTCGSNAIVQPSSTEITNEKDLCAASICPPNTKSAALTNQSERTEGSVGNGPQNTNTSIISVRPSSSDFPGAAHPKNTENVNSKISSLATQDTNSTFSAQPSSLGIAIRLQPEITGSSNTLGQHADTQKSITDLVPLQAIRPKLAGNSEAVILSTGLQNRSVVNWLPNANMSTVIHHTNFNMANSSFLPRAAGNSNPVILSTVAQGANTVNNVMFANSNRYVLSVQPNVPAYNNIYLTQNFNPTINPRVAGYHNPVIQLRNPQLSSYPASVTHHVQAPIFNAPCIVNPGYAIPINKSSASGYLPIQRTFSNDRPSPKDKASEKVNTMIIVRPVDKTSVNLSGKSTDSVESNEVVEDLRNIESEMDALQSLCTEVSKSLENPISKEEGKRDDIGSKTAVEMQKIVKELTIDPKIRKKIESRKLSVALFNVNTIFPTILEAKSGLIANKETRREMRKRERFLRRTKNLVRVKRKRPKNSVNDEADVSDSEAHNVKRKKTGVWDTDPDWNGPEDDFTEVLKRNRNSGERNSGNNKTKKIESVHQNFNKMILQNIEVKYKKDEAITEQLILNIARELSSNLGIQDFECNKKWLTDFISKHNVSVMMRVSLI